eukprot:15456200-Alexandrium_andersonii.AAC.1
MSSDALVALFSGSPQPSTAQGHHRKPQRRSIDVARARSQRSQPPNAFCDKTLVASVAVRAAELIRSCMSNLPRPAYLGILPMAVLPIKCFTTQCFQSRPQK